MEAVAVSVSGEERQEAKKMLTKRGYKTPHRDPAFRIVKKYDKEFDEAVQEILLQRFKVSNLAVDTRQIKLGL
jgi:hypothetical protein